MPRGRKKKASSLELLTQHKKMNSPYKDTMLRDLTQDEKVVEVESLNKIAERYHQRNGNLYTATRTLPSNNLAYLKKIRDSLDIVISFLDPESYSLPIEVNRDWHEEGIPLRCQRCSHIWNYKGKKLHQVNCSGCNTSVSISKSRLDVGEYNND